MNGSICAQSTLTGEAVWALLLALRQARRQWEAIPERLGLAFDIHGQAVVVPVTDPVTQRPGAEQQAGHDEGVCVDDPQPLRCRRAKLARQGRQGRVEDRIVQNDKQETGGDGHQKNPAVRVGGRHDRGRLREGAESYAKALASDILR